MGETHPQILLTKLIYFGDNPGVEEECLSTAVIPGEPIFFDYSSPEHEKAARPVLERCAIVLGYDIQDG